MDEVSVIVVAQDDADLEQVKELCEREGLKQVSLLQRLHTLRGFVDPRRIPALSAVRGVRSIEQERQIQLRGTGPKLQ